MQTADDFPDPLELLADCVNRNDAPSWEAFLRLYRALIRKVFVSRAAAVHADEFLDWFPGWFFGRRVHAAYLACTRAQVEGRCPDRAAAAAFLENYLATCVATAAADFFREQATPRRASTVLEAVPGAAPPADDEFGAVAAALDELPPEIRVPFRLRYWKALQPLPDAEAEWVARAAGCGATEVRRRIAQEAELNAAQEFPLSATFIGELLRLAPRADGSYNSVIDQRVRRARDRLRERLT
jgi:hypothetical protein